MFVSDIDERLEEIRKRVAERHRKELQQYEKLRDKVADVTARLSNVRATYATVSDNSSVEAEMRQLLKMPISSLSNLLDTARKSLAKERLRVDRLHRLFESVQQLQKLQRIVESSEFTGQQSSLQEAKLALERSANDFKIQLEEIQRQIDAEKHDDPIRAQHAELCDLGESLGLQSGNRLTNNCRRMANNHSTRNLETPISALSFIWTQQQIRFVAICPKYSSNCPGCQTGSLARCITLHQNRSPK